MMDVSKGYLFESRWRQCGCHYECRVLLFVIGFVEVMAFIASAGVGNARCQVNVVQSVLYVVGIGLSGYSLFIPYSKETKNEFNQ